MLFEIEMVQILRPDAASEDSRIVAHKLSSISFAGCLILETKGLDNSDDKVEETSDTLP